MTPDRARADLRNLIKSFVDGPMGRANNDFWPKQLRIYDGLLAEVRRLRSELRDAESLIQTALDHETDEDFRYMYEDFLEGGDN